ncbi:hypothetical protein DENSPDRAFT_874440 [Dentipellis sp. KUC8613]|nr:hypothetical protein DENSPDRAFT_874440 [Dentipellis sp. KUC8613]
MADNRNPTATAPPAPPSIDQPSSNVQLVFDYAKAYVAADGAAMAPLLTDEFVAQNVSTGQNASKSEWVRFIQFMKGMRDEARTKVEAPPSADFVGINGISEQQGVVSVSVWEIQDKLALYTWIFSIKETLEPKISKLWVYKANDAA